MAKAARAKKTFRVVAEELGFTEGPVWTHDSRLLVTSISHGLIYELDGKGGHSVYARTTGGPNGMTEGLDGSLYVTQNGGIFGTNSTSETRTDPGIQHIVDGEVRHIAKGLGAPNDLCFGPDDRLYFTDPRGWARPQDLPPGRVYSMEVNGEPELLVEGPAFTNGIAFGLHAATVYVAETFGRRVLAYPLRDGKLGQPEEFCKTDPGMPDGMCFDENGLLYVAATIAQEIQVFDAKGECIDRLPCGENSLMTNCCFGGPDGKTLFATDSRQERVIAVEMEVAGLALYPFR
jgi:gluconolactonase